jgi:hypothetical protein
MDRFRRVLPWVFFAVAALSRWPGLLPPNFSAVYALVFCAGAFFGGNGGWRLPFGFLVASDLALNLWYRFGKGWDIFTVSGLTYQACSYLAYGGLFFVGRAMRGRTSGLTGWLRAIAGGLIGAVVFYLVSNTASWLVNPFHNPEYVKTLEGWIRALTRGAGDWPATWEFFRNSLLSAGLFTALFGAAWEASSAESPVEKGAEAPDAEPEEAAVHEPAAG